MAFGAAEKDAVVIALKREIMVHQAQSTRSSRLKPARKLFLAAGFISVILNTETLLASSFDDFLFSQTQCHHDYVEKNGNKIKNEYYTTRRLSQDACLTRSMPKKLNAWYGAKDNALYWIKETFEGHSGRGGTTNVHSYRNVQL